ncbi:unnamed protein product [Pedinophyceae sp. YPF-701]|nr:unnamed protein product [Pedinophyceae sp. YPF-701]
MQRPLVHAPGAARRHYDSHPPAAARGPHRRVHRAGLRPAPLRTPAPLAPCFCSVCRGNLAPGHLPESFRCASRQRGGRVVAALPIFGDPRRRKIRPRIDWDSTTTQTPEWVPQQLLRVLPFLRNWEMVRRIAVTASVLCGLVLLSLVALPSLDFAAIQEHAPQLLTPFKAPWEAPLSLLEIGISPYITASIAAQLCTFLPRQVGSVNTEKFYQAIPCLCVFREIEERQDTDTIERFKWNLFVLGSSIAGVTSLLTGLKVVQFSSLAQAPGTSLAWQGATVLMLTFLAVATGVVAFLLVWAGAYQLDRQLRKMRQKRRANKAGKKDADIVIKGSKPIRPVAWAGSALAATFVAALVLPDPVALLKSGFFPAVAKSCVLALFRLVIAFCLGGLLFAGALIAERAAWLIEEHGLGDGTTVVICLSIAGNIWTSGSTVLPKLFSGAVPAGTGALLGGVVAAMFAAMLALNVWTTKLPLRYLGTGDSQLSVAGYSKSANVAGKTEAPYLPIKPAPGAMLVILSVNFMLLEIPRTICNLSASSAETWHRLGQWTQSVPCDIFVFATVVLFQALGIGKIHNISDYLMATNASIVGVVPGEQTKQYLTKRIRRLRIQGGVVLGAVVVAARRVDQWCLAQFSAAVGATSFLIVFSLVLSTVRQLQSLAVKGRMRRLVESTMGPLVLHGDVVRLP